MRQGEETIKSSVEAAMPRKKKNASQFCFQETVAGLGAPSKVPKTKYACVVGSHDSTRHRLEPTLEGVSFEPFQL